MVPSRTDRLTLENSYLYFQIVFFCVMGGPEILGCVLRTAGINCWRIKGVISRDVSEQNTECYAMVSPCP